MARNRRNATHTVVRQFINMLSIMATSSPKGYHVFLLLERCFRLRSNLRNLGDTIGDCLSQFVGHADGSLRFDVHCDSGDRARGD